MKRIALALVVAMGVCACQPAAPPVAKASEAAAGTPLADAAAETVAETVGWDVSLSPVLTLAYGDGLAIACEEAKGVLRLSFQPAWEKEGPFDKAVAHFGDTSFPLTIDPASINEDVDRYRPVYLLPANADTVTAVMMANNARLVVTNQDGEQERAGAHTESGAFDMFATTCAQMNGLR